MSLLDAILDGMEGTLCFKRMTIHGRVSKEAEEDINGLLSLERGMATLRESVEETFYPSLYKAIEGAIGVVYTDFEMTETASLSLGYKCYTYGLWLYIEEAEQTGDIVIARVASPAGVFPVILHSKYAQLIRDCELESLIEGYAVSVEELKRNLRSLLTYRNFLRSRPNKITFTSD